MTDALGRFIFAVIGLLSLAIMGLGFGVLELFIRGKMLPPWETYGGIFAFGIVIFLMIFASASAAIVLLLKAIRL